MDTLLSLAAVSKTSNLKLLLDRGADVNFNNNGNTALIKAIQYLDEFHIDNLEKDENIYNNIELLLKHGANVNIQNKDGDTALIIATRKGNEKVVKLLLNHNADKNIKNIIKDTAIDISLNKNYKNITMLLSQPNFY